MLIKVYSKFNPKLLLNPKSKLAQSHSNVLAYQFPKSFSPILPIKTGLLPNDLNPTNE